MPCRCNNATVDKVDFNTSGAFYNAGLWDNFAAKYSGTFQARRRAPYTFYLTSDDGAQLFINGVLVVNNDGLHGALTKEAAVTLTAGVHTIEIRYFEATGRRRSISTGRDRASTATR